MLARLQQGDLVIATKLERMFRSARDALEMAEKFKQMGVDLILLDISADPITSSPVAKVIFTIIAAFAELERSRLKERQRDGQFAKAARGGATRLPRYGFEKRGEGKDAVLAVNEKEIELINLCRRMRVGGMGPEVIARTLGEKGWRNRAGNALQQRQVNKMLNQVPTEAERVALRRAKVNFPGLELFKPLRRPNGWNKPEPMPLPPAPPSPQEVAMAALRARYSADPIILDLLTEQDEYSAQRARAAIVTAYGRPRYDELLRELAALKTAAMGDLVVSR
jgi:DNA invertase Pin-like site-specific DNA recombinase